MIRFLFLVLLLTCCPVSAQDPVYSPGDSLHIRLPDQTHFYRYGESPTADPLCSVAYKYEFDPVAKVVRYICMNPQQVMVLPTEPALPESVFPESHGWRVVVYAQGNYSVGFPPDRIIDYRTCSFAVPPSTNPDGTPPLAGYARDAWNCRRIGYPIVMFDDGFE